MVSRAPLSLSMGRRREDTVPHLVLVAVPGHVVPHRPDPLPPEVLLEALTDAPTPETVWQLALRWGWVGRPEAYAEVDGYPAPAIAEPVSRWLETLTALRTCVQTWQDARARGGRPTDPREDPRLVQLAEVTTQVGGDPRVQWQLQLDGWHPRASTLAQALWIACGDLVRRDGELRPCVECGRWMEIGPGAFSKNRQLCSDACKLIRHRRRTLGTEPAPRSR